jgi:anti-sigma factor RsiW
VLATRHAVGNRRRRHGVGARIAMLTSAGRVQRCRAPVMDPVLLPRSSGTYASSTVRRPSRKKARCRYVGYRRSSNQANDSGMPATGCMLCGGRLTVGSGAVSPAASYSSRGHLALNGSNQWNERYGVSLTISCHFQFGWRHRKRRISRG